MFVVRGQDILGHMEQVYISFRISGVLKYVPQSSGKMSDHLLFQWFRLIVENRPSYNEEVTALRDINDIRNGVFVSIMLHHGIDAGHAAILKVCHVCPPACCLSDPCVATNSQTPNHILKTKDIPPRHRRKNMREDVSYPTHRRYTLQWLDQDKPPMHLIPNNIDAAFKKHTKKPKPSDLLLHYNYGATAIRCWGLGTEVLQNRANPPRPSLPIPHPTAGNSTAGAGAVTRESVESEGQATWDEDDVMLFFLRNSSTAKERHFKKVAEDTRRIEQWRGGVPQDSV
jgi:hypothetical protein